MDILTILATGMLCITCFLIGARTGQAVSKGKDIDVPTINPMKLYREAQERKEADRVKEKIEALSHNIDVYDGTSRGQKDIPR